MLDRLGSVSVSKILAGKNNGNIYTVEDKIAVPYVL
jgi:DNA transposition AAA+ family ATPase